MDTEKETCRCWPPVSVAAARRRMERRGSILAGLAHSWASDMVHPGWPGSHIGLRLGLSWLALLTHGPQTWSILAGLAHTWASDMVHPGWPGSDIGLRHGSQT